MSATPKIATLIPHRGSMILIDRIESWDSESVWCSASSHRDPANPLRTNGVLGAACGVEYAAQAMAIHGGLTRRGGARPRGGLLASVRALTLHVARLDDVVGDLAIEVGRLAGEEAHVIYRFIIRAGDRVLLEGRAAAVLEHDVM